MNAIELLQKDHARASDLFQRLLKTDTGEKRLREKLFDDLRQSLDVHMQLEEQLLFPALESVPETADMVHAALEEHGRVKQLLHRLEEMRADEKSWAAVLAQLESDLDRHEEDEEEELYAKARHNLPRERIDELGRRMLRLKETLLKPIEA